MRNILRMKQNEISLIKEDQIFLIEEKLISSKLGMMILQIQFLVKININQEEVILQVEEEEKYREDMEEEEEEIDLIR
jgi:hypothetical protein